MTQTSIVIIAVVIGAAVLAPALVMAYIAKKVSDYTNERESKWDE